MTAPIEPGHVMSREKFDEIKISLSNPDYDAARLENLRSIHGMSVKAFLMTGDIIEANRQARKSPSVTVKIRSA